MKTKFCKHWKETIDWECVIAPKHTNFLMNLKKMRKLISLVLVFCLIMPTSFLLSQQTVFASSLSTNRIILTPKETYTLKLSKVKGKITWTSSNKKIATVSSKGKVTAKSSGVATITAKNNKKKYKCKVIVIKNWSEKELNALIQKNILTKDDVIQLIKQQAESTLSVYPNTSFDWKINSYQVHISSINLTSKENSFTEIANSTEANKVFKKYTVTASVKGYTSSSLDGQKITIYFSNENNSILNSISGTIDSNGRIDFSDSYLLNKLTEQIISKIEISSFSSSNGSSTGSDNDSNNSGNNNGNNDNDSTTSGHGEFKYVKGADSVAIIKYVGNEKNIIIPETIDGLPVKIIGDYCFFNSSTPLLIETVSIPKTVETIDKSAFSTCLQLKSVNIASGSALKVIKDSAFSGCSKLEYINLPDTLDSIGSGAFSLCENLKSVSIKNIKTLEPYVFSNTGITSISIPLLSTPSSIEGGAFSSCFNLENVSIAQGNTTIFSGMFANCTALTNITLPDTINTIQSSAFSGCSNLSKINIPNGVTKIDMYAFANCPSLLELTLPESITEISATAFDGCYFITLRGKAGSYVESYAKKNNIKFIAIP